MPLSRAQTFPTRRSEPATQRLIPEVKIECSELEPGPTSEQGAEPSPAPDPWKWELISVWTSIRCLTVILVVLLVYRDKAVGDSSMGLTFNAIISVSITAAKAAMLSAVASVMRQLKWEWYRRGASPLHAFDVFDEASRGGLWGAISFLTNMKWRSTAAIGAIVIVLSLAIDPFAQQLLTYPLRLTFEDSPGVRPVFATSLDPRSPDLDFFVQQSVNRAIWNDTSSFSAYCASGNCTYPPTRSISWCTRCEDMTNQVLLEGCEMSFDFSNGTSTVSPISCNISVSSGTDVTAWNNASRDGGLSIGNPDDIPDNTPTWSIFPTLTHVWDLFGSAMAWSDSVPWNPYGSGSVSFLGKHFNLMGLGQVDLSYDPAHPLQALTVKRAIGCVMNPCLRQYSVRVHRGLISVSSTKVSDGVVAVIGSETEADLPPWLFAKDDFPATCWVAKYKFLSDPAAGLEDRCVEVKKNETFCSDGEDFRQCTIDPEYIMCEDEASRQKDVI